ncbi:MAG TPA: AbrB/MazE/SpoVT family DNA-binding domain-containing protein [Candidatus Nanoarchaeia archaeon]|nr:AbrB/MazE/SpoVT family DNA-binding domain-containing protein [Candidatus Nanoarchaeia archaeon]
MKRKVIKQGHNTLTITLPSEWANRFNIRAGDEINLSERDAGIFISAERHEDKKRAEFSITDLDIPTIWKYFMAVYREGYSEVKVQFDPNQRFDSPYKLFTTHKSDMNYGKKTRPHTPFETIQEITNRFIGFEIIEHHADHCIIKDMAEPSAKEFDSSLRRVFLLILQMAEETLEAIRTEDTKMLEHMHDIDINLDKFHDYCIRVLNKTKCRDERKSHLLVTTLYLLELLGDEFKNVAYHIVGDLRDKSLKNILKLCEMNVNQFKHYYDLYYNFKKEKMREFSKQDWEIHLYLPKLYLKRPGKGTSLSDDELEVFHHFRMMSKYLNALIELRIQMEFN